ncbi:MAG: histidinol-phosphate transaminase [Desulfobacterales bacterium S5133MH4]|nr:MAG: histidinol-phosphate transaminase [Desulfobacterales bacterium S5133MH4]
MKTPDYIAELKPYTPGKPIEELEREYGISGSIKLASNENPIGPSPKALEGIMAALKDLHRYPDGSNYYLGKRLAEKLKVSVDQIVLGNGSNEIIELIVRAFLREGDEVIMPEPSFLMYEIMVQAGGGKSVKVALKERVLDLEGMAESVSSKTRIIFVNNPNNPTGTIVSRADFEVFLERVPPDVIVVVDEAYIEFVQDRTCPIGLDYLDGDKTVATLRTFSKAYGLAGLRIGYGVMKEGLANLLNRVRQPFNTNLLAQVGALAALDDDAFLNKTVSDVHKGLSFLYQEVERLGFRYFHTQTNFFLIDLEQDAKIVFEKMLRMGVIVRPMTAYGYPNYIRISVGLPEENQRLVEVLGKVR